MVGGCCSAGHGKLSLQRVELEYIDFQDCLDHRHLFHSGVIGTDGVEVQ